ncbi:class I SAM-dependent methyltransferase [Streptomyces sp. NPDC059943]|uniref:class I SAM-dependent methyltransferase n=1 Tax=Streptomyces sp. NPDC059943 TaxID=3347010 RepID=UPI0036548FAC
MEGMTDMVNSAQTEAWNGYEGRHWAEHQDRYDHLNDAANAPLLEAAGIKEGDRVLDIGCGNGRVTRLAALGGARAVGIDLSSPMLARARASAVAEEIEDVTFVQGDAQVHDFEEGAFDIAVSRFGVMFFADPAAAFSNIGRALRPGGRLAFVCPQSFSLMDQAVIFAAIGTQVTLPALNEDSKHQPASFADPAHTERVLSEAGFKSIGLRALALSQHWGKDASDASAFLMGWGPLQHWLALAEADERTRTRAHDAATEAFHAFETRQGVRLTSRLWLVTAEWP